MGNKSCHCNIAVPKQLLGGVFEVYVEDTAVPYIINSNQNCYFIYFDRTCFAFSEHSTYNIRILAETAIPLTGDINNDGVVDMFDISELLKTFGDKS